jgi:hypothetical protein
LIQYFAFNPIKRHQSIDRNQSTDRNVRTSTSPSIRISAIARTIVANWIPLHFVIALACTISICHNNSNLPTGTSPSIRISAIARTIVAEWTPPHFVITLACIDLSQWSQPTYQYFSINSNHCHCSYHRRRLDPAAFRNCTRLYRSVSTDQSQPTYQYFSVDSNHCHRLYHRCRVDPILIIKSQFCKEVANNILQ